MEQSLIFGNVNSADYDFYISGEGVFNAPKRDVEAISIPGRNGQLLIDRNRYENIEVVYPAFCQADTIEEFASKLSKYRNALASQIGYQRLTDTINSEEYRMGTFIDGFEAEPIMFNTVATIDLKFNCKPQRFLKSGEARRGITAEWTDLKTASGGIVSIDGSVKNFKALTVEVNVDQLGSGTPSQTNVRQINPVTDISLWKARKNLLRLAAVTYPYTHNGVTYTKNDDGTITANGTATDGYSWCQVGYRFYVGDPVILSGCPAGGSSSTYEIQISGKGRILRDIGNGVTIPPNPNREPEGVYIIVREGYTAENLTFKPMIRLPGTTANYVPWDGLRYAVNPSSSFDFYKGTYDFISGTLIETHLYADLTFTGRSATNQSGKYCFYSPVMPNIHKPVNEQVPDMYCNRLKTESRYNTYRAVEGISIHPTEGRIYVYIPETSGMTLEQAQAWLTENPIQVVYPSDKFTFQKDTQAIRTFDGITNVFSKNGDILSLEYGEAPNTISNPTLFPSKPMLEVKGYGKITMNNQEIAVNNVLTGDVVLIQPYTWDGEYTKFVTYRAGLLNVGDTITVASGSNIRGSLKFNSDVELIGVLPDTPSSAPYSANIVLNESARTISFDFTFRAQKFKAGTSGNKSATTNITLHYRVGSGLEETATFGLSPGIHYNASGRSFSLETARVDIDNISSILSSMSDVVQCQQVTGYSTISALGNPTYIDLELGEAYKMVSGSPVSLNNAVVIGGRLPELSPGYNSITYDSTITDLTVIPRWWKI